MNQQETPTEDLAEQAPTFDILPLSPEVRRAVDELGYTHPTPVQRAVFESVASGKDVVVQARTGTGKTAAFGLPIVDRIVDLSAKQPQVLVLSPTRELALQINRELESLARFKSVSCTAVYGGASMQPQIDAIRSGVQVIAGTPGRILDHLERGTLNASTIRALVLDESDEMLSMGFLPQITKIMEQLPEKHQTLLFSATLPPDVRRIAETRLVDPEFITLSGDHIGALSIDHYIYRSSGRKAEELIQIIEIESPESAIVFCNTRDQTKQISAALVKKGYAADWLNADLAQNDREKVMRATREGKLRFLVCTDVAARGIDISHLTHVINADFPESTENYVHRTGRTGRAGNTGTAISLITPQDVGNLYMLRLTYKIFPVERDLPQAGEIETRREADLVEFLYQAFCKQPILDRDRSLARRILASDVAPTIVAGLLRDHLGAHPDSSEAASDARRAQNPPPAPEPKKRKKEKGGKKRDEKSEKSDLSHTASKDEKKPEKKKKKRDDKRKPDASKQLAAEATHVAPSSEPEVSSRPAASPRSSDSSEPIPSSESQLPSNTEPARSKQAQAATKEIQGAKVIEPVEKMEVVSASSLLSKEERALLNGELPPDRNNDPESRRPRREAVPEQQSASGPRAARIFVDVGKRDEVREDDILDTLADKGFPLSKVSFVHVKENHTFVGVLPTLVEDAIDCLDGEHVAGLVVRAELARSPRPRAPRR